MPFRLPQVALKSFRQTRGSFEGFSFKIRAIALSLCDRGSHSLYPVVDEHRQSPYSAGQFYPPSSDAPLQYFLQNSDEDFSLLSTWILKDSHCSNMVSI